MSIQLEMTALSAAAWGTSIAALLAARTARRRLQPGPSWGAALAMQVWWLTAAGATALFALDAALLAFGPLDVLVARALDAMLSMLATLAMGSLAYAVIYLRWGTTRHLAFLSFFAGALAMACLDAVLDAPPDAITSRLLIDVLLASGGVGRLGGIGLLAATFFVAFVLLRSGMHAPDRAARRRSALFSVGLMGAALGPLAYGLPIPSEGFVAAGIAVAGGAVFLAYRR